MDIFSMAQDMKHNVSPIERILRVGLGLGLLTLMYFLDSRLRWLGLAGIVPLVTGTMGWCPSYLAFGIRLEGKS